MKEFISEHDNKRIIVLNYLIQEDRHVSIKEICEETNYTFKTVRAIIDSFEENYYLKKVDLEFCYDKSGKIESIKINNHSLTDIAFFYLENSLIYKMIMEIFLKGKIKQNEFCSRYFVSQSTFSRNKKKLAIILDSFDLTLTSKNSIDGRESQIRSFFILFFLNANSKWLFSDESFYDLENVMYTEFSSLRSIPPSQKNILRLLLYVSKVRNSQGKLLGDYPKVVQSFNGEVESTFNDVINYTQKRFHKKEIWINETAHLFICLLRNQIIDPELLFENKFSFRLPSVSEFEHETHTLTKWVITSFLEEEQVDYKRVHLGISLLLMYTSIGFYDQRRFLYIYNAEEYYKKSCYEQQVYDTIKEFIEKLPKDRINFKRLSELRSFDNPEAFVNQMYLLVLSLMYRFGSPQKEIQIKIFVQSSKIYVSDIIKKKIKRIYSNRVDFINEYNEELDLYVTDREYVDNKYNIQQVVVPTFSDEHSIFRLCRAIEKEIIKKIDNEEFYMIEVE